MSSSQDSHQIRLFGQIDAASPFSRSHGSAFSKQAAKRLSSCAMQLKNWGSAEKAWDSFWEPAVSASFWAPLHSTFKGDGQELQNLYEAVCGLLTTFVVVQNSGTSWAKNLVESHDSDLQSAAAAIVHLIAPDSFGTLAPQFLHETRPIPNRKRADACPFQLAMFHHGSWRFFAARFVGSYPFSLCFYRFDVPLPLHLRMPNSHYTDEAKAACKVLALGPIFDRALSKTIQTGACVFITYISAKLRKTLASSFGSWDPALHLKLWFNNQLCEGYDETWLTQVLEEGRDVIVMRKFLGLTHPDRPFAVSAQPIVLESDDLVQEVLRAVESLGQDLSSQHAWAKSHAVVPFAFPPALCDADRNLQVAHCYLALGSQDGTAMVAEATQRYASERLGDSIDELIELDNAEMERMFESIHSVVKSALEALRQMQISRRESESVVAHIIDGCVSDAWYQIRCRHEWQAVEKRVNAWGQERRRSKKKFKSKSKQMDSTSHASHSSLASVVQELHFRTEMYMHTAFSVSSLVSADVLRLRQCESELALTASDVTAEAISSFAAVPDLVVDICEPRAPTYKSGEASRAHRMEIRNSRKKHFLEVLDASAAEDRRLALAHVEENQLKLAIQESLSDFQERNVDEMPDRASSNDVQQKVLLLKFLRPCRALRDALLSAPELAECRALLAKEGHAVELPEGAKVFVAPHHYTPLMDAIHLAKWKLFPEHVFVDPSLEDLLLKVVKNLPRSAKVYSTGAGLKRYSIPTGFATEVSRLDTSVSFERTFINVRVPSSLLSECSVVGPVTV